LSALFSFDAISDTFATGTKIPENSENLLLCPVVFVCLYDNNYLFS